MVPPAAAASLLAPARPPVTRAGPAREPLPLPLEAIPTPFTQNLQVATLASTTCTTTTSTGSLAYPLPPAAAY
eukprot:3384249-Rhodomonas_salina.1